MDNLSEKIIKAFEGHNEMCLVDECPKDASCGECWCREIKKYITKIQNETISDVCEYFKKEWALDKINTLSDFDKIAKDIKNDKN